MKKLFPITALASLLFAFPAKAETTECTEISALPAVITVQGVYCLKQNLVTSITSGNAIEVQTNNVTIDMNGWKLGGAAAGAGTSAIGIFADDRKNLKIRNGIIRGFFRAILIDDSGNSSGHTVEQITADGNRAVGISVRGARMIVRDNHVVNTGSHSTTPNAYGIRIDNSTNVSIFDNIVDGVSQSGSVRAIAVFNTAVAVVKNNSVFGLSTATTQYGIYLNDSDNVAVIGNQLINPSGATTGIFDEVSSTGVDCIGNVVRGYTTGSDGCDYSSGNHVN